MKNKKVIIGMVVVVFSIVLIINGKSLLEKRQKEIVNAKLPNISQMSVQVVKAKQDYLRNSVSFLAQVVADKSIKLSTKFAGYVEKVMVKEAQKVKKGELLVVIDSIELQSSLKALEVTFQAQKYDVQLAQSIYARNQKLYDVGGLSKEKLDISKVTLEMKQSMLENTRQKIVQLKHQLSYLKIVAPFDGIVDAVLLHEGDLATVGKPIISMSNGKKKLLFSYAPSKNNTIAKGQMVFFNDEKIGYIKSIYPTSKNGLILAEVSLIKMPSYPVGINISIDVLIEEKWGCLLPSDTLVHKQDGTFVMEYNNESFKPMKIDVEIEKKDKIIVTPCPKNFVAFGNEAKLLKLQAYDKVNILGEIDAK